MFRSLFDIVERQRDLREEDRIALLEQWKNSDAKPEITGWWKVSESVNSFSELKAFIAEAPVGAELNIEVKGTIDITESLRCKQRITLTPGTTDAALNFHVSSSSSYRYVTGFLLEYPFTINNSSVGHLGINIIDETGSTNPFQSGSRGIFRSPSYDWGAYGDINITIQTSKLIELGDVYLAESAYKHLRLFLSQATIKLNSILAFYTTAEIEAIDVTFQDMDGNAKELKDVIPIVRDANGVPRNIVSNIVL